MSEEIKMRQAFDDAGYFTIEDEFSGISRILVTEILYIIRGRNDIYFKNGIIWHSLPNQTIDYVEKVFYDFLKRK